MAILAMAKKSVAFALGVCCLLQFDPSRITLLSTYQSHEELRQEAQKQMKAGAEQPEGCSIPQSVDSTKMTMF